jgi:hypothetical protein
MDALVKSPNDFRKRADWRSVEQLYRQFSTIRSKDERIPPEIAGALANHLGRVLAFYEDNEKMFIQDLLELWSSVDDLHGSSQERFRALYFDSNLDRYPEYKFPPEEGTRRRPRPFEAAIETSRRLIDLNNIRHELASVQSGGILGGSVSYGRFYNVTGAAKEFGSKSSDTDLLLVLKDYEQLNEVADRLAFVQGVDKESLELFRRRLAIFLRIRSKHSPCIFSHKLLFWSTEEDPILSGTNIPGQYKTSLHVFSLADFDYLTLKGIPILDQPEGSPGDFDQRLTDYRDSAPIGDRAYDSRSFAGIPLGKHPLDPATVELGFLANVQVCLIKDDRYCPGLHQNLILPQFEKRWETEEVRLYLRLLTFRWKILERLHTEKTKRPFEEQSLSLSHVRYFVFSPHITRRADRG